MSRRLVYLAGPYSAPTAAGRERNIRYAWEVALALWKMGLACICPHLNTQHMDGEVGYEDFMEGDLEIVSRVDAVVVMPDYGRSLGTLREIDHARSQYKPVYFWPGQKAEIAEFAGRDHV